MFMQKINYFIFIIFTTMITFSSCTKAPIYEASITDLNGTWLPNWSYKARLNLTEEEQDFFYFLFSWGVAKSVIHLTNDIDISADEPFITFGGDGGFDVTSITQIEPDSIKVSAYQGRSREPDERLYLEFIFHFIDYNTLWIEVDYFEGNKIYGKDKLWHRISGPEESE